MFLFPSITYYKGRCVSFKQGRLDSMTDVADAQELAQKWQSEGAKWINIFDADAVLTGQPMQDSAVRSLIRALNIPVQFSGGIKNADDVKRLKNLGVKRIILGQYPLINSDEISKIISLFGADSIACSITTKSGRVAVRGSGEVLESTPIDIGLRLKKLGIKTLVYSDITRDGLQLGPDAESCNYLAQTIGLDIIAWGGIKALAEIQKLAKYYLFGAIIDKALYENKFTIAQALKSTQY